MPSNYTQEQMWEAEMVGESKTTGMIGKVWEGDDGWYGEVADSNDYCQGAAWGVATKEEAVKLVLAEIEVIDATSHYYTSSEYQQ